MGHCMENKWCSENRRLAARGQHQDCWLLWWPVPARERVLWAHLFLFLSRLFESDQPQILREKHEPPMPSSLVYTGWDSGLWAQMSGNWQLTFESRRLWLIFLCTLLDCCSNVVCKINLGERKCLSRKFIWFPSSQVCSLHWFSVANNKLQVRNGTGGGGEGDGLKARCREGCALFWNLWQRICFLAFSASRSCITCFVVPSFTFKTSSTALIWSLFCCHLSDYSQKPQFENIHGDFSGGPVAKTLNAGDLGSVLVRGTRSLPLQLRV